MTGPYDDIIDLPHHTSPKRPRMSRQNRAAQFASFAAVTTHSDAVKETARLTTQRITLDENTLALLDAKLRLLRENLGQTPQVSITYFLPDDKKEGGRYRDIQGTLKKIDDYNQTLILEDGSKIPTADIIELESTLFSSIL